MSINICMRNLGIFLGITLFQCFHLVVYAIFKLTASVLYTYVMYNMYLHNTIISIIMLSCNRFLQSAVDKYVKAYILYFCNKKPLETEHTIEISKLT